MMGDLQSSDTTVHLQSSRISNQQTTSFANSQQLAKDIANNVSGDFNINNPVSM